MTREEIKTLSTVFNGGIEIDDTAFSQLLITAKSRRESSRDWMVLRTQDYSITFTASDNYLSTKNLPTRFMRVINKSPEDTGVFLIDSNGSKLQLFPIPLSKRYDYRDTEGYYYIDVKNGTIGRTGSRSGTLYIDFLQYSPNLTADEDTWVFPEFAHPLLAADIVQISKGVIDWDRVNASQVPYTIAFMNSIEQDLAHWDARLQQAELGL